MLEHLYNPQKAVNEIYRVLKKNGICILSTRFIHPFHPSPKDYFRFTEDSLSLIFNNFRDVKVIPHGNRLQIILRMLTKKNVKRKIEFLNPFLLFNLLNPLFARIDFKDKYFPCGFIVIAKK